MKSIKTSTSTLALLVCLAVSGSAAAEQASTRTTVSEKDYQLPQCSAPVASVVIGKITCKSNNCMAPSNQPTNQLAALALLAAQANGTASANFAGIDEGMAAMLTTTLKATGCFDIQEREAMDEVAKELALVGKKVDVQQADFMISGAITSMDMSTTRSSFGGGFIPIIGAITNSTTNAELGMDIRIIDVNRAKILDSKTFFGNNETSNLALGMGGLVGGGLVGGGFSSTRGTPMEPIVRDVLTRVASYVSNKLAQTAPAVQTPSPQPVPAMPPAAVPVQESAGAVPQ